MSEHEDKKGDIGEPHDINDVTKLEEVVIPSQGNDATIEISAQPNKEIELSLGDIILIQSPHNEILNNNTFIIDYIDTNKVTLINTTTFDSTTLPINSDGIIGDGSISSIKILSSNPNKGYARQNELVQGTWINIYFGGDIPTVITGQITNLEADQIEVKTTDNDIIYINFNYQGIPDFLPIETFEIRPPPTTVSSDLLVDVGEKEGLSEELEDSIQIPTQHVQDNLQKLIFAANDIKFGEIIHLEEEVTIDRNKFRFNVEAQSNDMLEEMLSKIPNSNRTDNVLNNINIMIRRFLQLRQLSSTFDANNNITGILKITSDDRPLATYLSEFNNTLHWIMMVATNIKKIYPSRQTTDKVMGDYIEINQNENMLQMEGVIKSYKTSSTNNDAQNKYAELYSSLDPYMTPFESLNPEVDDIFDKDNRVLIEANVNTNINAIIDNLGDLYSTVVAESKIVARKFILERYTLGSDRLDAINLKGNKMVTQRVKLTNNDPISINSIITLPEPTVRFSKINLPGTSLLVRADLNLHFINYWQLLKQNTATTNVIVNGLNDELEYTDTNFVDNIKQYMLNLSDTNEGDGLSKLDIYKTFLKTIIPKTRVLFNLIKKYIKGKLSLVDVISYLEPFMIYPIDLTYMQYKEMSSFIIDKIKEYNIKYKEYSASFNLIRTFKHTNKLVDGKYIYSNPLFTTLDDLAFKNIKTMLNETYGIIGENSIYSGSEFLKKITVEDSGRLYNTAVSFTNLQLMYPTELNSIFQADEDRLRQKLIKDGKNSNCATYIVAKKYYDIVDLTNDNNKPIYFDKEFDITNYDLLDEKYKKEREALNQEELTLFLAEEFKRANIDADTAEYNAVTMVNQAKQVRDGVYAILTKVDSDNVPDEQEYYVRQNNEWVVENSVDPSWFIKDDDVLCNINYNCVYNSKTNNTDKCDSVAETKTTVIQNALKDIFEQFDKNYNVSKEDLRLSVEKHMKYYEHMFDKLKELRRREYYKYNEQRYALGLSAHEATELAISPYKHIIDAIMGQSDFVKKQTDIIKFTGLYGRQGSPDLVNLHDNDTESINWIYCKETSIKLMPYFKYQLATAFFANTYIEQLNAIIKSNGRLGDEGDSWVDKNSGEIIAQIDFDVSEGYKDGFVNKSREILVQDATDTIIERQQTAKEQAKLGPEGAAISNMISTLSSNMGLDIEPIRRVIIKLVTELMNDPNVLVKEATYKQKEKTAQKKGKKMPDYNQVYSQTLLYLTLGIFLIAIQTSIPSIKTRKTFPGCVRSFTGFPFEGEGDESGLKYIACVALSSKDKQIVPWNSLFGQQDKIVTTIKFFITKYIWNYPEIRQLISSKVEYLIVNPIAEIPPEHDIANWVNLLPPLQKFHIPRIENIASGFINNLLLPGAKKHTSNELYALLVSGKTEQLEKLLVIDSKIIMFSMAIQELIQQLVEKKNLLLKASGRPYLDNACCNEKGDNITTLAYFEKDNANISSYNVNVAELTATLNDIRLLTQSSIMLSEVNTKRQFPPLSTQFSTETIYYGFVAMCKFHSSIALNEELSGICASKPDYLSKHSTIHEKIEKLQRDGRNYSQEQFLRLFQIISKNNIINVTLNDDNPSCVTKLQNSIDACNADIQSSLAPNFLTKLSALVVDYDVSLNQDTAEPNVMYELKNYLDAEISTMRRGILDFIKRYSKTSDNNMRKLSKFLTDLNIWKANDDKRNSDIKISDDSMYNYINLLQTFIALFSATFPTMIRTKTVHAIAPPPYWNLAKRHVELIKSMVSSYYDPLEKFYGVQEIDKLLFEVTTRTKCLQQLAMFTPALTNIRKASGELYSVFNKRTSLMLYEYYFLSTLMEYVNLSNEPSMVMHAVAEDDDADYSSDLFKTQEARFVNSEVGFVQGDEGKLKQQVSRVLVAYIGIMIKSKKTLNITYEDVVDKVFKSKEAEKYLFTDRLKDMTEEDRVMDTILKQMKLGPIYSRGLAKGLRTYDDETYEQDKQDSEKRELIENTVRDRGGDVNDMDMDIEDAMDEEAANDFIEQDELMMNTVEDGDDGDPYGDEYEDDEY